MTTIGTFKQDGDSFNGTIATLALKAKVAIKPVAKTVENATIVFVVCDRGDRYLSTGVFPA